MKLLYNPFKKKKGPSALWKRVMSLGNFTWNNKKAIDKLSYRLNEVELNQEELAKCCKPKAKRGRPRKNA